MPDPSAWKKRLVFASLVVEPNFLKVAEVERAQYVNAARAAPEVATPRKSELSTFPFPAPSGTARLRGVPELEAAEVPELEASEEALPIKLPLLRGLTRPRSDVSAFCFV